MQRSGDDAQALGRRQLLALLLLLYEPLTSLFAYLPPLLGFGAWRMLMTHSWIERGAWAAYFYLYEADHALAPLSLLFTLGIYLLFMRRLRGYIACRVCLYVGGVVLFYAIWVGVHLFYTHILGIESLIHFQELLFGLITDLVLVYAV